VGSATPTATAGFVTPKTGEFQPDPGARADGMPFPRFYASDAWRPVTYDAVIRRWLPVLPAAVSPDHRMFAYTVFKPPSTGKTDTASRTSELHLYDIAANRDRLLLTSPGELGAISWADGQIVTDEVPSGGGILTGLQVDPQTGVGVKEPFTPPVPLNGVTMGSDEQGNPIVLQGARGAGEYAILLPDGQRTVIKAAAERIDDFDPTSFVGDSHGVWGANYDGTAVWPWQPSGRSSYLRRLDLHAGPTGNAYVTFRVVGPCV
jgi:hypothetical protein